MNETLLDFCLFVNSDEIVAKRLTYKLNKAKPNYVWD